MSRALAACSAVHFIICSNTSDAFDGRPEASRNEYIWRSIIIQGEPGGLKCSQRPKEGGSLKNISAGEISRGFLRNILEARAQVTTKTSPHSMV